MQKYAAGLEQIVQDQEKLQLEFRDQFKSTEYKLLTVSVPLPFPRLRRITLDLFCRRMKLNAISLNHVVALCIVANAIKKSIKICFYEFRANLARD